MNWKKGRPPLDFVGFAIEYKEPGGKFFPPKNRLSFPGPRRRDPNTYYRFSDPEVPVGALPAMPSSRRIRLSRDAGFHERQGRLSYGEAQQVSSTGRETYPK
jgi:hypothetical protein